MRNRPQLIIGALLLLWGILALLGTIFHIDFWMICWPALLIGIGVWLIWRPRMLPSGMPLETRIIGDIHRFGNWPVTNEEFWTGIGDIDLDFAGADIPAGETTLRMYGFIGDIDLTVPQEVGVSLSAGGFVSSVKIQGAKQDSFLAPVEFTSPDYASCDRRLRFELVYFINDLTIRSI